MISPTPAAHGLHFCRTVPASRPGIGERIVPWFSAASRLALVARTVVFLPQVIPLVAAGIAWSWLLSSTGLVNQVLDRDNFFEEVAVYARQFLPPAKAARAVGRIKRAVCSGMEVPLGEGLAIERELQQHLFQSQDAHEGLKAYIEKRKPSFQAK